MIDSRWPHFTRKEIECPCCRTVRVSGRFMDKLEATRQKYGKPMKMNSICRCKKHNADPEIKGAPNSSHLAEGNHLACAGDVSMKDAEERMHLFRAAYDSNMRQVIVYNWGLHLGDDPAKPIQLLPGKGQ